MGRLQLSIVVAFGWWFIAGEMARSAPPNDLSERVGVLVDRLNDDDYGVRNEARLQLFRLSQDSAHGDEVRRLVERYFLDPKQSLEVRDALRPLLPLKPAAPASEAVPPGQLPAASKDAPAAVLPGESELDALLASLDDPRFDARDRAEQRLLAAAVSPAVCGLLLERLAALSERGDAAADAARRWQNIWQTAWGTWLADGANAWHPQPPDDARLQATLDRLVGPDAGDERAAWLRPRAAAERLLLLWLADERTSAATAAALGRRLADDPPIGVAERLDAIYAWTRPAMAAEFWMGGKHRAVQHLVIGVPNQPDLAPKPSLFDRCDDKTAHCVSGNSLAVGDHPVGVFFPHPNETQTDAQFHLVNLPTPRRRLAYEFVFPILKKTDLELDAISDRRHGPITRRTVDFLLERRRLLMPREIDMFRYLDPVEASRFVEPYLSGVADERYDDGSPTAFGNGSLHGWFCYTISQLGTPAAGRGLAAAIDRDRILEPTAAKPYRIEWIAAFYLASQAPWEGVDAWLAKQIDRTEPLRIDEPEAADVGASAAALLLARHGEEPSAFHLERHVFDELIDLENPGFRFTKPEGREKVKRWWDERQAAANAKSL